MRVFPLPVSSHLASLPTLEYFDTADQSAMERQDQRKRTFSQTFHLVNQARLGDNHVQSAKRNLSYALNSTGLDHLGLDREEETSLDLNYVSAFDEVPGTQVRHPVPVDLQYDHSSLYDYAPLQYELYSNGPGPEMHTNTELVPRPVVNNYCLGDMSQYESPPPTPAFVRGHSMFGPSPYVRGDGISPSSSIVDSYFRNENVSTIHVYSDYPMSDATTAIGPLTPSALKFADLSLNSQAYSVPSSSPLRVSVRDTRTTVTVVPTSSFAEYAIRCSMEKCHSHIHRFPIEIHPNDVVIVFDKGKEIKKVDEYPLCAASRFFAQLLDGVNPTPLYLVHLSNTQSRPKASLATSVSAMISHPPLPPCSTSLKLATTCSTNGHSNAFPSSQHSISTSMPTSPAPNTESPHCAIVPSMPTSALPNAN